MGKCWRISLAKKRLLSLIVSPGDHSYGPPSRAEGGVPLVNSNSGIAARIERAGAGGGGDRPYPHVVWGGHGCALLLLALVISPLAMHRFRDGAPFLLRTETPPTVGRSLRCFHIYMTWKRFANLIPFLFGRLRSPSIS